MEVRRSAGGICRGRVRRKWVGASTCKDRRTVSHDRLKSQPSKGGRAHLATNLARICDQIQTMYSTGSAVRRDPWGWCRQRAARALKPDRDACNEGMKTS